MKDQLMDEFKTYCKSNAYALDDSDYNFITRYIDTFPEAQQEAVLTNYLHSYSDREKYKASSHDMRKSAKRANLWLLNKVGELKLRKSMEMVNA